MVVHLPPPHHVPLGGRAGGGRRVWTSFHTPGGFCISTALGLWLPEINLLHIAVSPRTYHAIGFELFSSFLAHFHFYYLFFYPNDRAGIFIPVYSQRD